MRVDTVLLMATRTCFQIKFYKFLSKIAAMKNRSFCTLRPQFWYVPELFREFYNSGTY